MIFKFTYVVNTADSAKKKSEQSVKATSVEKNAGTTLQKTNKSATVKKDTTKQAVSTMVKPVTTSSTVAKKDSTKRNAAVMVPVPVTKPKLRTDDSRTDKDSTKHITTAVKPVTTSTANAPKPIGPPSPFPILNRDTSKQSANAVKPVGTTTTVIKKPLSTATYATQRPQTAKTDTEEKKEDSLVSETNTADSAIKEVLVDTLIQTPAKTVETNKGVGNFFTAHLLKTQHTNPVSLNREGKDWIFYCILLIVVLFTATKAIHNRNVKQMRDAILSNTISNQIIRDDNILFQRASMFLTVVFYLSISLLLYNTSNYFGWDDTYLSSGFGRFFIFVLFISLVYTIKLSVLKMLGFTLKMEKFTNSYIFNVFLINNILGVLLIPVLIAMSFMNTIFYSKLMILALFMVGVAYLYRISRGILIGAGSGQFSAYYLFLYLCTLEIAPLLFFAKLLIK